MMFTRSLDQGLNITKEIIRVTSSQKIVNSSSIFRGFFTFTSWVLLNLDSYSFVSLKFKGYSDNMYYFLKNLFWKLTASKKPVMQGDTITVNILI